MQYTNATAVPRTELTDVIIEGIQDDTQFVGLQTLAPFPLALPTGHVPKIAIGTGNLMRATAKGRAPGSDFDRWQSGVDAASLTLVQVAEEISIPDENSMLYADYFDLEAIYSQEAANRLLRGIEMDVAATLINTGNFDAVNGGVAYSQANIGTISAVADILAAIRRLKARGEKPDTVIIPGPIYDRIRQSTLMLAYVSGSIRPGAEVTTDAIQASLVTQGITKVLVAEAYVNQSQDSTTNSINPVFPLTYIWVGNTSGGALRAGGVGRTFYWEKEGPIINISSYRDEPKKSNIIRAMKTTVCAITNSRAGTLIGTQVTT